MLRCGIGVRRSSGLIIAIVLLTPAIGIGIPYLFPKEAQATNGSFNKIVDFNGDKYADLAIGVPEEDGDFGDGAVNVIYGSPNGGLSATYVPDQVWKEAQICGCEEQLHYYGSSIGIGDFNGDNYSDLAFGGLDAGVYVVYGSSAGLKNTAASDGTGIKAQYWDQDVAGVEDFTSGGDFFGDSLATGDFNGDGYDDLAIGVPKEGVGDVFVDDPAAIFDAGAVNVIYGSSAGLKVTAASDGTGRTDQFWHQDVPGVDETAEQNDLFGSSLAAGDFNGDGYDDLGIGVPGETTGSIRAGAVNIIYGSSVGLRTTPAADGTGQNDQFWHQDNGLIGTSEASDMFGLSLASRDFNKDGFDDLAIGIPLEDVATVLDAGAVNVIYGSSAGLRPIAAADGTGRADQRWHQNSPNIEGTSESGDHFGYSLTTGDYNGDGYADLAVGVPGEGIGTLAGAGAVNVIYGSSDGLKAIAAANGSGRSDQMWHQNSPNVEGTAGSLDPLGDFADHFGATVTSADFNGDGYYDLAIGVPGDEVGSVLAAGAVNVIYGSPTGLSATFVPDQLWNQDSPSVEEEAHVNDCFGCALAGDNIVLAFNPL